MSKFCLNITICLIAGMLYSCGSTYSEEDLEYYYDYEEGYEDGEYCAEVEYYNPNTGTRSTYTLNVEVEDNSLIVIYWPSGGWLDADHFYPEELDADGYCYFTSDMGYDYEVYLNGPPCSFTDENAMYNDVMDDIEEENSSYYNYGSYNYYEEEDEEEDDDYYDSYDDEEEDDY